MENHSVIHTGEIKICPNDNNETGIVVSFIDNFSRNGDQIFLNSVGYWFPMAQLSSLFPATDITLKYTH